MTMYQTEKPKNEQNLIYAGKLHCVCRWVKVVLTTLHYAVSGADFLQIKNTSWSLNVLQTWPKKPASLKIIVCKLLIQRTFWVLQPLKILIHSLREQLE